MFSHKTTNPRAAATIRDSVAVERKMLLAALSALASAELGGEGVVGTPAALFEPPPVELVGISLTLSVDLSPVLLLPPAMAFAGTPVFATSAAVSLYVSSVRSAGLRRVS